MKNNVILASASPRRKELLKIILEDFKIIPSKAEEIVPKNTDTLRVAEHLARVKAEDIANSNKDSLVIGADTCVIIGDEILGKPKNREDAKNMISKLSGNIHYVVTGCCIIKGKTVETFSEITKVEFFKLTNEEIENYLDSDEPYDKAGAYGIQGKGALLVKKIDGDYFNVVGLPIASLNKHLQALD